MNKAMELNDFLEKLGFSTSHDYGDLGMTLDRGKDRFRTEVWLDDGEFYFGQYLSRGFDFIREGKLLDNANNLSTSSKTHWLEMKGKIIEAGYEVRLKHE